MTEYCKPSDVRLLVSTTLEDVDVSRLIEQSSAEIDKRIGAQSTSDQVVEKICALITAHAIKMVQPSAVTVGMYQETRNPLEAWRVEIERLFKLYRGGMVKASTYQRIDEDMRYTVS